MSTHVAGRLAADCTLLSLEAKSKHCCLSREALARATEGVEHGLDITLRGLFNMVNPIKSIPPFLLDL